MFSREQLFDVLSANAYQALVEATRMAVHHQLTQVSLSLWLREMIRQSSCNINDLLLQCNLEPEKVAQLLERDVVQLQRGDGSSVDIAQEIEDVLEKAILVSVGAGRTQIVSTAAILIAALNDRHVARDLGAMVRDFRTLDRDELLELFTSLSSEDARHESKDREPGGVLLGNGDDQPQEGFLEKYADDMTELAENGKLDPVVGRSDEVRQMIDVLLRRRQNNPLLIGDAGVGKTAVVELLAQLIIVDDVPELLRGARVYNLDLGRLQSGASMRGEFESRLKGIVDEVIQSETMILLFCDEAHTLVGAGGEQGTGDAVNLLKPLLARGELRMIAATTWSEFKQYMESDAALARRFQNIFVAEPSDETAITMVRALRPKFAEHHGVVITDDAIESAVKLSRRHLPDRNLPDKAISLLDTACARVALVNTVDPAELQRSKDEKEYLQLEIDSLYSNACVSGASVEKLKRAALREGELNVQLIDARNNIDAKRTKNERAIALWQEIKSVENESSINGLYKVPEEFETKLEELRALHRELVESGWNGPWVEEHVVGAVLSEWTGVPLDKMLTEEADSITRLLAKVEEIVFDQTQAISPIVDAVKIGRAELNDPSKPLGIFMLAGATGTGKTETARALADVAYGGERNLVKFNMTEFQEAHTISVLKGAPPGYVGYGKGGVLTESVRKRPYSVILLDEFDKAHRDVQELFYDVFDKGSMEDAEGRTISFLNTLIILTTNLGSEYVSAAVSENSDIKQAELNSIAEEALAKGGINRALLGRMRVLAFRDLQPSTMRKIVEKKLVDICQVLAQKNIQLRYDEEVLDWVMRCIDGGSSSGRAAEKILHSTVIRDVSNEWLLRQSENIELEMVVLSMRDDRMTMEMLPAIASRQSENSVADANVLAETTQLSNAIVQPVVAKTVDSDSELSSKPSAKTQPVESVGGDSVEGRQVDVLPTADPDNAALHELNAGLSSPEHDQLVG